MKTTIRFYILILLPLLAACKKDSTMQKGAIASITGVTIIRIPDTDFFGLPLESDGSLPDIYVDAFALKNGIGARSATTKVSTDTDPAAFPLHLDLTPALTDIAEKDTVSFSVLELDSADPSSFANQTIGHFTFINTYISRPDVIELYGPDFEHLRMQIHVSWR